MIAVIDTAAGPERGKGEASATAPRRPLLTLSGAVSILAKTRKEIINLVDSGDLAWAWNLSAWKSQRNLALRILPHCVADYAKGKAFPLTELSNVLPLILPDKPTVSKAELAYALNASGQHIDNLGCRGLIKQVGSGRSGPGGGKFYQRESVVSFLEVSRIGSQTEFNTSARS